MPNVFTDETFSTTYKDDFRDSDHYHRILFNSGRALQARELTQMQTIIQEEIARFARNIFKDGASVSPGAITVNNKYYYVKLDPDFNQLPADTSDLIGREFTTTEVEPGIKFRVVEVVEGDAVTGDPPTLYIQYTSTSAGTSSDTTIKVSDKEEFEVAGVYQFRAAESDAAGTGTEAYVAAGDFFAKSHFVFAEKQSIIISKYSSFPTVDLGFKIIEDVITTSDTTALFDNQGAVPNETSPGADRYRIRLQLATRDQVENDENFVYVAQIENGILIDFVKGFDRFNQVRELVALRTKEESGNYVAKPFIVGINDLNDSNLQAEVSPGTAYVSGHRVDLPATKITIPKAIETEELDNEVVFSSYGNYVIGNGTNNSGLFDTSQLEIVNLKDAVDGGGTTIGTAKIRGIEQTTGSNQKYYLIDVKINAGENFRDVRSLDSTTTASYVNIVLNSSSLAELYETNKNISIFSLPRQRPSFDDFDNVVLTVQKTYRATGVTGTSVTISAGGSDIFTDTGSWLLCKDGDPVFTGGATFLPGGTPNASQMTIGNISAGDWTIVAYVQKASPVSAKTKGLQSNQVTTFTWATDAITDAVTGAQYLQFPVPDVIKVKEIRATNSTGDDISRNFIFDNGQRDNFYDLSRLTLKSGKTMSGVIYVKYDYFTHSAAGNYFNASSYVGAVAYKNIPSYTVSNGVTIPLRDAIDFRSSVNSSGTFIGGNARIIPVPQNNSSITSSITYFKPRKDKLIVDSVLREKTIAQGAVKLLQGEASFQPQFPPVKADTMDIYNISLNPGSINDSDLTLGIVRNKRYTMKDIARLEDKVNRIGRVASLGLLEVKTANLIAYDSAGNDRTKAGFFIDNLKDFSFTDNTADDYRASLDRSQDLVSPRYYPNNVKLKFNTSNVSNTAVLKGDNIYLPHTTETLVYQSLATTTININPFEVILSIGQVELSPSSDHWIEVEWAPDSIVDKGARIINVGTQTIETRDWGGLLGSVIGAIVVGALWSTGLGAATTGSLLGTFGTQAIATALPTFAAEYILGSTVGQVVGGYVGGEIFSDAGVSNSDIVTDDYVEIVSTGDTLLRSRSIPYMRSIKVHFRAQSLRPETKHFAFFDGVPVSDFCKQEPFVRFANRDSDFSNIYRDATQHPDGPSELISDSAGTIEGSFFIPSTESLRFRTGEKMFKLLDISVDSDNGATSSGAAQFTANGTLETYQRNLEATRIIEVMTIIEKKKPWYCFWDPIAQSFFINQRTYPNGVFITDVDLFFSSKSSTVPVQVQIREMENGIPVEYPIPQATKFVSPSEVSVVDLDPASATSQIDQIRAAPTNFEFGEPIYLSPNKEYAIVVLADTVEYNVYVAETYEFIIGTTAARVNRQPTLGSLFESQNGTTWTPNQTKDLMFKLNKARFSTDAVAYLENATIPSKRLEQNCLDTTSGSSIVKINHRGHGFIKNDNVTLSGFVGSPAGIPAANLNGSHTILNVDHTGYTIDVTSAATSSVSVGGDGIVATQNVQMNEIIPIIQNLQPNGSTLSTTAAFTTGSSYGQGRNTNTNTAYGTDPYIQIYPNNLNILLQPKLIASSENETSFLSGNKSLNLKLQMGTTDTHVSPIIDLQRAAAITVENSIDWQQTYNTPIEFVAETEPTNGSAASKHITTITNLQTDAVGLEVIYSASLPDQTAIDLYYRIGTEGENLRDKNFIYFPSSGSGSLGSGNRDLYREYIALIGGQGGTLPAFTQFQLKFVMKSQNSSAIPRIADIRAIALSV